MPNLVLSYSRVDRAQIRAVVDLLKASYPDRIDRAVYWDGDFEPGEDWFRQISTSIDSAPQLFVFWCSHSAGSPQVRREVDYALGRGKRVVPVLMDDTKLRSELASIHAVDLRGTIRHRAGRLLVYVMGAVGMLAAVVLTVDINTILARVVDLFSPNSATRGLNGATAGDPQGPALAAALIGVALCALLLLSALAVTNRRREAPVDRSFEARVTSQFDEYL